MNALSDLIRSTRGAAPARVALTARRSVLTNGELFEAAHESARLVRRATSRANAMVVAVLPLSADALVLLVAAITHDFSLCFIDPAAPEPRRTALLEALQPDAVVDEAGLTTRDSPHPSPEGAGAPGYVAMSSGSTGGGPKGVLSSWSSIGAFAPFGAQALDLDEHGAWAEVSHPSYDLAMTNLLVALAAGCRIHLSAALGDRLRPLGFTEKVGATHLRLAPRFIELAANERTRPTPGTLRVWGSGGDRLAASAARQVFDLGVPTVINTYGTSETIGFASAARLDAGDELAAVQGTVSIGRGQVGAWGTRVYDRESDSMLAIESPHLPSGYLFGGSQSDFPRWEDADRVLTGDRGGRVGDQLYCLGRAGRRVKRSASFVDLDDIDLLLRESHGLTSFTTTTPGGALVSLVEGPVEQIEGVLRRLSGELRPDTVPDELVPVRALPRLGNGKVDQAEAQRWADRSPAAAAETD